MRGASGFSLDIRSTTYAFLFVFAWMFHCMIFVPEMLKSWVCGGRFIGICCYICWLFNLLLFPHLRHLLLAVGRAFSFFIPFPLVQYPHDGTVSEFVFFIPEVFEKKIVAFLLSLDSDWLFCSNLVGNFDVVRLKVFFTTLRRLIQDLGLLWKDFVRPVVWVCVLLLGTGWFQFLSWIFGSSLRRLGCLLRSSSI